MTIRTLHQTRLFLCSIALCSSLFAFSGLTLAQSPATPAEAAKVIDLSKFPLLSGAEAPNRRDIAGQSYNVKLSVTAAAKQLREQLSKQGWKELAGAMVTDQYASAQFQKQGYTLSLMVMPGSDPGVASVVLTNFGNVDLSKLPVPSGFKDFTSVPTMRMVIGDMPVEEAKAAAKKQLIAAGWEEFGSNVVGFSMRRAGVKLNLMVQSAPAQGNRTMIQFSSELLSLVLPIPAGATVVDYNDSTGSMMTESTDSQEKVVAAYREALGEQGWKATTENTIKVGFRDTLVFRNEAKEMLDLTFQKVDDKVRSTLKYTSAERVAELDAKAKVAAEQKRDEMQKKAAGQKLTLPKPAAGKVATKQDRFIKIEVDSGKTRAAVKDWVEKMKSAGWSAKALIDEAVAGQMTLTKDGASIEVQWTDPGFIPGEFTISCASGSQLVLE